MSAPLSVAVQGELGSNSELATLEFFAASASPGDISIVPCPTFGDLFAAVDDGRACYAMAPVENSLAGSIHQVWSLLASYRPPVAGEISLRIRHCLIAHPGTSLSQIRRITSHPQALAQCAPFLQSLKDVIVEEAYDTAGAVKLLRQSGRRDEAAIASEQAAVDYEMEVVQQDLQERDDNYTRFLVLGPPDGKSASEWKVTVLMRVGESASQLQRLLTSLVGSGLKLAKVETAKRPGLPWEFDLYVEGLTDDPAHTLPEALKAEPTLLAEPILLGPYPRGSHAEPQVHRRPR
ncbi:MAG: prephenate dehydratase domain-containing protein [Candidatus Latescibacterota bacterium]|nr:prephenate dehydratase domain-containing protein [Candidatus Latescibacterota bacterium]